MRLLGLLILVWLAVGVPAQGQEPDSVAEALERVYSQLQGLEEVEVSSEAGVVTLTGTAASSEAAERAASLAEARDDVVAVENRIEVTQAVSGRVVPLLTRLRETGRRIVDALPLLAIALAILIFFWWLGRIVSRAGLIRERLAPNPFVGNLIGWIARAAFLLIGLLIAFQLLDATALLGSVLGGLGVLGIALGFAVRDTVENFIASILLSIRQPFGARDLVEIEGHVGHVLRLTTRATILMDRDGNHVRIPNAAVYKGIVVNYTRNPSRRFTFEVGVDASIEPTEATDIALQALERIPTVLDDPAPSCLVQTLGDSNVVLTVAGWVDQRSADFLKTRSAAIATVKQALEDAEIALPEPIYNVRIARGEVPVSGSARKKRPSTPAKAGVSHEDLAPDDPVADLAEAEPDQGLLREDAPKE